jgi:copper resistance protein B
MRARNRSITALAAGVLILFASPVIAQTDHHTPAPAREPSAPAPAQEHGKHGDQSFGQLLIEQLEYRWQDGKDGLAWDARAWYGGDYEKIVLKTEGSFTPGHGVEEAEVRLLYSRLIAYHWDILAGARHDFRPEPSRSYGVIGIEGDAPGFVEVDLSGFISEKGDLSASLSLEHDLLITQRLILQPKADINIAVQEVPELGIGQGINDIELALRLRYELTREFAPYVGIAWQRKLGETASLARAEDEDTSVFAVIAGVRFWF